jgi:hypothetical protein
MPWLLPFFLADQHVRLAVFRIGKSRGPATLGTVCRTSDWRRGRSTIRHNVRRRYDAICNRQHVVRTERFSVPRRHCRVRVWPDLASFYRRTHILGCGKKRAPKLEPCQQVVLLAWSATTDFGVWLVIFLAVKVTVPLSAAKPFEHRTGKLVFLEAPL